MKKSLFLLLFVFALSYAAFGQVPSNVRLKSSKTFSSIKKDKAFTVDTVAFNPFYETSSSAIGNPKTTATYVISVANDKKSVSIPAFEFPKEVSFSPVDDNLSNFWFAQNLSTLKTISEINDLYSVRSEMEAEANEYINTLAKYGLIYDDPFLESYLYSIVNKILPNKRADGFPYDLKLVIIKDETMNACVFPNGIMIVNLGLLSELHTEDELVAVLSHEIGHFVANHSLVNMRKMEKKIARAEFWAGLATAVAAVSELIVAESNNNYYSGDITASTAVLSTSIANEVLNRIGANYSKEQEKEADLMALKVLGYLGYDKNGLATLFQRMTDAYNSEGNWAAYYLSGDHPSLKKRIEYSGTPYQRNDPSFEKIISFAVTEAAISKYTRGRFSQSLKLASQNINNNVGTDDDYLIKALCIMNLYSDSKHNQEARDLVRKAKTLNPGNPNIVRTEIIASLRCNENGKAKALLEDYQKQLRNQLETITNKDSYAYSNVAGELNWARKMAIKVSGL